MNKLFRLIISLALLFLFSGSVIGAAEKLIDLDFKNADIKDLLRALAVQGGVTFIIDNDVTGNITIHLSKVTFSDALNIITKSNNLTYTKENKVYHLSQLDTSVLKVNYENQLFSVEARNARLDKLFESLSQKTGVNLVPAPELKDERITILLEKIALGDGIKTILLQAGCTTEIIGEVTYIKKDNTPKYKFSVTFENNALTVDAQKIPLPVLVRAIAEKTGASIIPDQNLNTSITIFFQNLSVGDGLAAICDTFNLLLLKDGQVWRIAQKTNSYRVRYKDKLLSVDADAVEVSQIVNEITNQTGINIMLAKEIRGSVTAHFQNLPLAQALSVMFAAQGWTVEKNSKYYYITNNPNANQNIRIAYDPESGLFDVDIQFAQLTPVLSEIARRADINIVVFSQVNWNLSNIRLKGQSLNQVLDFLLKGTVFTYRVIDNTYIVGDGLIPRPENSDFSNVKVYTIKYIKADQLLNSLPPIFPRQDFVLIQDKNALIVTAPPNIHTQFQAYLNQIDVDSIEDRTEVVRIKYLKAEDVLKYIPPSIPKGDIIVVKEMNAITITGPQNMVSQVKQYIDKIDQPNPMIVFDVMVLKLSDTNTLDWGLSGRYDLGGTTGVIIDFAGDLGTWGIDQAKTETVLEKIKFLIDNGQAKVVQNPTITTLNGYPTNFNVSNTRSYVYSGTVTSGTTTQDTVTTKSVSNSLIISITPWVSVNNQITMEIKPKITEYGAVPKPIGDAQPLPDTTETSTETTVRVNNKQTVIISGLKSTRQEKNVKKIPILGDIPLLGYLFKSVGTKDIQDEFVIIITPTLVDNQTAQDEATKHIGERFGPEINEKIQNPTQKTETTDKKEP